MIIRIEDLKTISSILLSSLTTSSLTANSNIIELASQGHDLILKMSTGESYIEIRLPQDSDCNLEATIDAELFLKLIEKSTSETLNLEVKDNALVVKGSGVYKFPLIYMEDQMFHIPTIDLPEIIATTPITTDILQSIYRYNIRELGKGTAVKPLQKLFYLDQEGCITFTQGACINTFHLESPVKILLNEKIVKLFKLFEADSSITLNVGPYFVTDELIQTRVQFKSDNITVAAILPDNDTMVNSMPAETIRRVAYEDYPSNIVINRLLLLDAINRLLLFSAGNSTNIFGEFTFSQFKVRIKEINSTNYEEVAVDSSTITDIPYVAMFDLLEWKTKLKSCTSSHITIKIGTSKAGCILEKNIIYVLPECTNG